MALKNTKCTTVDPARKAVMADPNTGKVHAAGVCPGDIIAIEGFEGLSFVVGGVTYARVEKCQLCGAIYPG
jgi:hypothetical protein